MVLQHKIHQETKMMPNRRSFKILNGYENIKSNMFCKLNEGSRNREHKAALVKEQCS